MLKGGHSERDDDTSIHSKTTKHKQYNNLWYQPKHSRRKTQTSIASNNQQHKVPAKASPMDDMYDKCSIQQRVVDEMQDSVKIDGKSIITASTSVLSSNELFPKYNELKIDTAHFYNTLASSLPGTGNRFVKSVIGQREKHQFSWQY
jgi:hypothetical protein